MTTWTKVWMPSLVSIMSIHQRKELNMVKRNTYNYSHPTWKPRSLAMATKVLRITSWVPVRSLPWTQRKGWIPIGSMECVHTHIKGCLHLKDGVIQVMYEMLWKNLEKIIERLGRLIELEAKCLSLRQNMIKFGYNGPQISHWKTC
jgi:hypothetical protein